MKPEYSGEKLRQEDIFTIGQLDVTKTSGCPFRNLLEFASCYVKMAKEKDLRTFKFFLGRSDGIYTDEFPKEYSLVLWSYVKI